ncbi:MULTISPECIES: hypothetical protein [unclassified Psychrobacter]|uniref:hypothetical protein n=1 Tax=unclassified Psychrobacter TaxID=196806 RepID=UPI0018F5259A|nr:MULTISPECIES: hypothetical protein [unclassified Psychrobacter]
MDKVKRGSIEQVANELYDELLTTGSSLLDEEVLKIVINAAKAYHTWSGELAATDDNGVLTIDSATVIAVDDWEIMQPVVLAHCDLTQARRLEAMQEPNAGISTSEAMQLYKDALATMKKEAFQFMPASFDLGEDDKDGAINLSGFWDL